MADNRGVSLVGDSLLGFRANVFERFLNETLTLEASLCLENRLRYEIKSSTSGLAVRDNTTGRLKSVGRTVGGK